MRNIHTDTIINTIKEMCIEANLELSSDVEESIILAEKDETHVIGKKILNQLIENMQIAKTEKIPICQDTGMAVVFINLGQDVHIEGIYLEDAIQEGIRRGYNEGFLRKSIVSDPIIRENTKDNTPGIIHYNVISGDKIELIVAPKGFGSENMSRVYMLKPSDGEEGIKNAIIETVKLAGANACPPMIVGVGIGGNLEKCSILAKRALTRNINDHSNINHIRNMEIELKKEINELGIGPGGFGGKNTILAINIESYPTHIAGLPVAINICCHVNRHISKII